MPKSTFVLAIVIFILASSCYAVITDSYSNREDTWIRIDNSNNFVGDPFLRYGEHSLGPDYSLLKFSIFGSQGGPIPDGVEITSATLRVYVDTGGSNGLLYEATTSWNPNSVTGTNVDQSLINPSGPRVAMIPSIEPGRLLQHFEVTVTSSVRKWSQGTISNQGWIIIGDNADGGTKIGSRQQTEPNNRPKLTIEWVAPPTRPPTLSPTTLSPTQTPTDSPTTIPSSATQSPTNSPTTIPTIAPTQSPQEPCEPTMLTLRDLQCINGQWVTNERIIDGVIIDVDLVIGNNVTFGRNITLQHGVSVTVQGCVKLSGNLKIVSDDIEFNTTSILYECREGTLDDVQGQSPTCNSVKLRTTFTSTAMMFEPQQNGCYQANESTGIPVWGIVLIVLVILILPVTVAILVYLYKKFTLKQQLDNIKNVKAIETAEKNTPHEEKSTDYSPIAANN